MHKNRSCAREGEKKPDIGYLATVGEKEPSSRGGGKRRAVNDAGVNCECVSSRIYASRRASLRIRAVRDGH